MDTAAQRVVEKLFETADNHGHDSGEPDHTVGDLQDLFREAWEVMTDRQKVKFLRKAQVYDIVSHGSRDEFISDDLANEIEDEMPSQEAQLSAARGQNVDEAETKYWAWIDTGELKPLGACKDFSEADSRAPGNTHWIFSLAGLAEIRERINHQLD